MALRVAVLVLAAAILVAGCGGDERLSRAEYQEGIQSIVRRSVTAMRLYNDLTGSLPPRECATKARQFRGELDRIVDEVDELAPPKEVERLHENFVAAARESVGRVGELAGEVEAGKLGCPAFEQQAYRLPSNERAERILEQLERNGYVILGD